ncbi:glycosyltransferase family 4 protein [Citrobacter sedlakii]|uniref:glycosyltransferase family 4 protein n=1 Tax=Citrobacter sedlakii TaxID=67826 RepID=UPI001BACC3CB|nr:glycosyltransferase family 4 protein [Citrobacter sedlakii]EKJ8217898.1 glycosyltransferase family 4 protein [Citrobacter sedlakii]QUC31771.1 glycosyltransferase family 4 protein [Citrobacter sedlakii]
MKVLLIGNLSSTVILFREKVIKELISKGYKVYTLTMDDNPANFKIISEYGAKPYSYRFSRSGLNPFSDVVNTYQLHLKIKKIKPDIVFNFFPKPVIFGTLAAKLAGVNKIYSLLEGLGFCYTESADSISFKRKVLKLIQSYLYKITLPFCTKVLFLNKDDYDDLIIKNNINIKKHEIIGGIGVNLTEFEYEVPNIKKIHFGMVSRLLIEKGVKEFVLAAKQVKEKYPEIEFSIAGAIDDNPGGITQEQISLWKKEGVVDFLGQISDVKSYLKKISIFVLPSYREGVPKSTQEAMAIGRPVITTDVPGCRETILDGVNGLMVPPYDAEALAEAMIFFIKEPQNIIVMGRESRIIAEQRFDEVKATNKLLNLIK